MAEPILFAIPASVVDALAVRLAEHLTAAMSITAVENVGSPYLSVSEAADHLRCSKQRIYDLVSARQLPVLKEGKRSLFLREHLDALVKEPK